MAKEHGFFRGIVVAFVIAGGLLLWWLAAPQAPQPVAVRKVVPSTPEQTEKPRETPPPHDSHGHSLQNVDSREPAAPNAEAGRLRRAAAADLQTKVPGVRIDFDAITGGPKHIMATGGFLTPAVDLKANGGKSEEVVLRFVDAHRDLFGHDSSALRQGYSRITRDDTSAHNGMRTLVWQQELDGIPVFQSILRASLTKNNELITLGGNLLGDPAEATRLDAGKRAALIAKPPVAVSRAVVLAAANIDARVDENSVTATGGSEGIARNQNFQAPAISDTRAGLTWVATGEDSARLAWEVTLMSVQRGEMFRVLVDAENGGVLLRQGLTEYISPGSYRVFTNDSPTPMSPGLPAPGTTQAAEVPRALVTLEALDTTASPNGWIDDGINETRGNNVDAHLDLNADNTADLPRPQGSPNRVFDFPLDLTQAPASYQNSAVTNLFYWNNYIHDRYYQLGFTETAGNFQNNTFGRGGAGNDAVQADAQDGSGTNNANFSTPSDGSAGRMQMYVFTGPTPDRDGDFDQEIVIHEYTHGLSNRLVGGGVGISSLQPRGMGEGWSDFYALCLLSQPTDDPNGAYASGAYASYQLSGLTQNYYFGIRRYPYSTDLLKNPLTFKDIDPTQASTHATVSKSPIGGGTADEVHNQGEVWCVTLWDVRANLIAKHGATAGNNLVLQLVTDGMKLAPVNPNFLQARDAIVQADLVNNSGANRNELWAAFAKRGMGSSAISPASTTTTGLVENHDIPDFLGVGPSTVWSVVGTIGGPFSGTNTYTLVNSGSTPLDWTAAKTQPWLTLSAAGGTLAAGASTTVTASLAAGANSLTAGIYQDSVTFTNVTSGVPQQRGVALTVEAITQPITGETWESGTAGSAWVLSGTNTHRTLLTTTNSPHGGSYHLTMDSSVDESYSRNEATWTVDLAGHSNVQLRFWVKMFSDEADGPPASPFTGGADFDGVAISADGTNWYEVQPLRTLVSSWTRYTVDLDAAIAARGLNYNSSFKIRFNHYDNYAISTDGFAFDDIELVKLVNNRLALSLPASASEGSGTVNGTLTVTPVPASDLTVSLASSLPAQAAVPASLLIPAGQSSVVFPITLFDDTLLDGTQGVDITASAASFVTGSATVAVEDNETATLSLNIPASTAEGVSDLSGLVTMSAAAGADVAVALSSSVPADLQVPASVVIPAGQTSAVFPITPVDDNRIDGTVTANLTAHVANWTDGTAAISVADNDISTLSVNLPAFTREGDGTVNGTVVISGTLATPLTVTLVSDDPGELIMPVSATIAAGQTSVVFAATVVNDPDPDGTQNVTVTASASGFNESSDIIAVQDNDAHHFAFGTVGGSQAPNAPFAITVSARDVNDAPITNYNSTVALTAAGTEGTLAVSPAAITTWVNGVFTGNASVATFGTNVVLTANDSQGHIGTSNPFNVQVGPVHHFTWATVASPKTRDNYFPVTVTAKDAGNNTVSTFAGTTALKAIPQLSTQADIGTGTTTFDYPMHTGYHDSRTQVIYLASELGGPWRITSLSLNVTTLPGQTMNAWTIRMKHTALASYAAGAQWEGSGWTTVYQANQTVSPSGWVKFTFSTPFNYDGTNNLMVDFSHNNTSWTSSGYVLSTARSPSRTAYFYSDSSYGDPLTWSGTTQPRLISPLVPNLRLTYDSDSVPVPITPATSGNFVNGVWSGNVAVPFSGNAVKLRADDDNGHLGDSNSFTIDALSPPPGTNATVLSEPFESTALGSWWTITGTNNYRTQLSTSYVPHAGARHLTMDAASPGTYSRNEATLTVNLAGRTGVLLKFWAKEFSDIAHTPLTNPFTGGADFDGVAISANGTTWYEVQGLRTLTGTWSQLTVNLDAAISTYKLSYNSNFRIRFNQYGNDYIPYNGIAIDDILITATAPPVISVTAPSQAGENAGTLSGTVTLPATAAGATTVTLASNANAKLTVPANVTVAAGQTSVGFPFTVIDNTLLDGNRDVAISASTAAGAKGSASVLIVDNEISTLALTTPASVTEGATGITATATLGVMPSGPITFTATSSDTTEITVPATVTFPAGQTSIAIPLTVVNDTLIDGPQSATITLSAAGWTSAAQTVAVLDNETTQLALSLTNTVNEAGTATGNVSITGTLPTGLVVALSSGDPAQLTVPASVTIPAGSTSAIFTMTGVDDALPDGPRDVTITASAAAFTDATGVISVLDNDAHHFSFVAIAGPKDMGVPFSVTITAEDVNNAMVTGFIGTASLSAGGDSGAFSLTPAVTGAFSGGVWTGNVACNAATTNARITATSGGVTGTSNAFELAVPPTILLTPASVSLTLDPGETATRTVSIGNSGASLLNWSIAPAVALTEILSSAPAFGGREPVAKSEPVRNDPAAIHVEPRAEEPPPESAAAPALANILMNLNLNHGLVRALIPTRYAFTDGITGTNISDGGGDMYDNGNYLGTNLGSALAYSDNVIATSPTLGAGGRYFTRKYDGLWVFAADVNALTYFEITGNLGADGSGSTDSAVLSVVREGVTYRGFVKRVYGTSDPSVNHLIITADNGSVTHEISTDTNNDYHRLVNLTGVTRVYHVLYGGTGGAYIDNTAALAIMTTFLDAVATPDFVTPAPTFGTVAAGGSQDLTLTISAAILTQGTYNRTLVVTSNDPARPLVNLPVTLNVTGVANLGVSGTGLTATGFRGGPYTPASQNFTLTNLGGQPLSWTAGKTAGWLDLSASGGSLDPGASVTVTATLNATASGLASGTYPDTVTFTNTSNGAGNTTRPVTLTVNPIGELSVTPASGFDAGGPFGGPFSPANKTYTLTNDGDAALNWTASEAAPWLNLTSTSGTLAPGANVTVTATLDAAAKQPGAYSESIAFTNTTNGRGTASRPVNLTVFLPAPVLSTEPPSSGGTANTVSWNEVSGAASYEVQAATDAAFTHPVSSGWIDGANYTFNGLADGAPYHYRVRANLEIPGNNGSWSQTTQAEFATGTANNVSTGASPGSVVLSTNNGSVVENFDGAGTAWSNTIFPNTGTGTFERLALSGVGPNTTPQLPVNQAGDLEARLSGVQPSALMADIAQNRFADGSIEAYIAPANQTTLHYAGLLLRSSRASGFINGYAALLIFYSNGTVKADFSRIIGGSDNGTGNWFYSNTSTFSLGANENIHARFSISGSTLTLRLWRVSLVSGVVTETPIDFYSGGNTLTATDSTYTAAGLSGLYDSYSNVNQSLFDDVSVSGPPATLAYLANGTLTSPVITPAVFSRWNTLDFTRNITAAGTGITMDILNAGGALIAANVASGTDLNTLPAVASQPAIRLRANLSTGNTANTPGLDDWSVSWQATPSASFMSPWSSSVSSLQDASGPSVNVSTPHVTSLDMLQLDGIAGDVSGVASLTVNGIPVLTSDGFHHWSTAPAGISPGWNQFGFIATDTAVPANTTAFTHGIYRIIPGSDADLDGLPDSWESAHGLDLFSASGASGALGDFDHDGLANLLEFAFGLDPAAPGVTGSPRVTMEINPADGLTYLVVTYRRLLAPGTLSYQVEVSGDCKTWSSEATNFEPIGSPVSTGDGITKTTAVRVKPAIGANGHPGGYVRVKVTAN